MARERTKTTKEVAAGRRDCDDTQMLSDIVEGRYQCPTLKGLADLADRVHKRAKVTRGCALIQEHLRRCPECAELYEAASMLAEAADRAVERALANS